MITQRSGQPGREKLISGNTDDDGREMGKSDEKKTLSKSYIAGFTWIELFYYEDFLSLKAIICQLKYNI